MTHVRRRTFGGSCEVLAVTPLPRFLEIGNATTCTYFSSLTPNISIETPAPTLPVLLLFSMGSSKDPHKVSHFLPPESIATGLGPLSSQNLDTSLPSEMPPCHHSWFPRIVSGSENQFCKRKKKEKPISQNRT